LFHIGSVFADRHLEDPLQSGIVKSAAVDPHHIHRAARDRRLRPTEVRRGRQQHGRRRCERCGGLPQTASIPHSLAHQQRVRTPAIGCQAPPVAKRACAARRPPAGYAKGALSAERARRGASCSQGSHRSHVAHRRRTCQLHREGRLQWLQRLQRGGVRSCGSVQQGRQTSTPGRGPCPKALIARCQGPSFDVRRRLGP